MRFRVVAPVLGLTLLACTPPRPPVVAADTTPIAAPPPTVVAPPVEPPAPIPRLGPFRRESPILFQPSELHALIEPVAKSVRAWAISRDGAARVEIGCRKGVRVVDARGPRAIAGAADRVVIAIDGSEVAREHAGGIFRGESRSAAPIDGTDAIYLEDRTLAFHRGCEWFAQVGDAAPASLGESCGTPIRSERGRSRLWLAELDPPAPGGADGRLHEAVRALVGLEPGQAPLRVELAAEGPSFAPALSPDAAILCATFDDRDHDVLQCRLRDGGVFERVAKDVFGPPQFADDAHRMVFTVGDGTTLPRDLHLIDFDHRIVRKLGRIAHHRLAFLPGGEHVVAFDGARGLVFELDTGWVTAFGEEADDWVALAGAEQPGSFFATRLRTRCAELVRVRLPARDGGSTAPAE